MPGDPSGGCRSVQGRDDSGLGPDGGSRSGEKPHTLKSHLEVELTNAAEKKLECGH